ncbi:hypothetical protein [Aeribacillus sp. FSL M8-0235]
MEPIERLLAVFPKRTISLGELEQLIQPFVRKRQILHTFLMC